MRKQAFQRLRNRIPKRDFFYPDIIDHQDGQIVYIRLNVVNIAHQIQQFQETDILQLDAVMIVGGGLTAVNYPADCALQKGVYGIIKQMKRHKGIFIPGLDFLCRFLKTGQHGTFAAGQMLARVAMLSNFRQHLLYNQKLIRHKRESRCEFLTIRKALDIENWIMEGKQVFQHCVFLVIYHTQKLVGFFAFCQNTALYDLVHRRRRQAEPCVEPSLNLGKVIPGNFNNRVDCLLAGHHDPDFAPAARTDFLYQRL